MAPYPPKSAKKSGSRKSSADAMETRPPKDPRSSFSLLSKHKIWIAAALAAVIVAAIGLGYQLLNGSTRNMASASAATFVGSETCAGCHRAEAGLWRSSQHRLAMQHADDKTVLGDFSGASFDRPLSRTMTTEDPINSAQVYGQPNRGLTVRRPRYPMKTMRRDQDMVAWTKVTLAFAVDPQTRRAGEE